MQPANWSASNWRWSTTGSHQAYLYLRNSTAAPRAGLSEVFFKVDYCVPPAPNPALLGCYRSELALTRQAQGTIIDDWVPGFGASTRWFGFSLRLPENYSWDASAPQSGPCFQMHGGDGPGLEGLHPNLNLQVDASGCAPGNTSCPVWALGVQSSPSGDYDRVFALGPAAPFGAWEDWVLEARFSPRAELGSIALWRGGRVVVPKQALATAYNDTVPPYLKFGVYRGDWKERNGVPVTALAAEISYGALKVGDNASSFAEVDTAVAQK